MIKSLSNIFKKMLTAVKDSVLSVTLRRVIANFIDTFIAIAIISYTFVYYVETTESFIFSKNSLTCLLLGVYLSIMFVNFLTITRLGTTIGQIFLFIRYETKPSGLSAIQILLLSFWLVWQHMLIIIGGLYFDIYSEGFKQFAVLGISLLIFFDLFFLINMYYVMYKKINWFDTIPETKIISIFKKGL